MSRSSQQARRLIDEVVTDSLALFTQLATEATETLEDTMADSYGATPSEYFAEASRLMGIRLRSVGVA
jgi:hypothetical protein